MRYTLVPEPREGNVLDDIWQTLPDEKQPETDCCGRIVDGTDIEDRESAREWLVFLHALDCVSKTDGTYHRTHRPSTQSALDERFRTQIYGVTEIRAALANAPNPLTVRGVLDRLDDSTLDRLARTETPETYVDRVLRWAVELGLVVEQTDGFSTA